MRPNNRCATNTRLASDVVYEGTPETHSTSCSQPKDEPITTSSRDDAALLQHNYALAKHCLWEAQQACVRAWWRAPSIQKLQMAQLGGLRISFPHLKDRSSTGIAFGGALRNSLFTLFNTTVLQFRFWVYGEVRAFFGTVKKITRQSKGVDLSAPCSCHSGFWWTIFNAASFHSIRECLPYLLIWIAFALML